MLFAVLCPGTPEGSTGSGSGFKASQKTGLRLKVSSERLGEAGNRTCDPWFTRQRFIPYTKAASLTKFPNILFPEPCQAPATLTVSLNLVFQNELQNKPHLNTKGANKLKMKFIWIFSGTRWLLTLSCT